MQYYNFDKVYGGLTVCKAAFRNGCDSCPFRGISYPMCIDVLMSESLELIRNMQDDACRLERQNKELEAELRRATWGSHGGSSW